jgi:hypothetical protein
LNGINSGRVVAANVNTTTIHAHETSDDVARATETLGW